MELPLIKYDCACGYEDECKNFVIADNTLKGLIYLMGSEESKKFALTMADKKLRRHGADISEFNTFVDKIKNRCPYYQHS